MSGILNDLLEIIQDNVDPNYAISVDYHPKYGDGDDPKHWTCLMIGPEGTPYSNGYFRLTIDFDNDPPTKPPEIKFKTKIYHLNINNDGHVCLKSNNEFQKGNDFLKVFYEIYFLFIKQNAESTWPNPEFNERKELYKNHREDFNRIAREWTKTYATSKKANEIYE
jgi:ubiquitin-conjugating enzyme E2 D/E